MADNHFDFCAFPMLIYMEWESYIAVSPFLFDVIPNTLVIPPARSTFSGSFFSTHFQKRPPNFVYTFVQTVAVSLFRQQKLIKFDDFNYIITTKWWLMMTSEQMLLKQICFLHSFSFRIRPVCGVGVRTLNVCVARWLFACGIARAERNIEIWLI